MRIRNLVAASMFTVLGGVMGLVGCAGSDPGNEEGDVGEVTMQVTNVPVDGTCLQVTVVGSRTVTRSFDLTAGQSSTVTLKGLPTGSDTITEAAFAGTCAAVTAASIATWVSDPVGVVLQGGVVTNLTIVLHRNGQANITSDFQDDPGSGDDGGAPPFDGGSPVSDAGTCAAGLVLCGPVCSNTAADAANCGSCGHVCSAANGASTCIAGICTLASCSTGFADCDGSSADGCETSLTSVTNCGSCGHVCATANGSPSCTAGTCTIASCNVGFADCDGSSADGCETSLTSVNNCGSCGHVCAAGQSCVAGACK